MADVRAPDDVDTAIDGRTARRDRNRVAVLDAVLDLFAEGELDPSPEAVARRSGVSLRSVYRYVADREDLTRAAIARHTEKVGRLVAIPGFGHGPLAERVERFVAARLRLYDAVAPVHRASRLRAPASPVIAEQLASGRIAMREQMEHQFAVELRPLAARERRNVGAAVDALTQLESLEHLRDHRGMSSRVARDVLVHALIRLLS